MSKPEHADNAYVPTTGPDRGERNEIEAILEEAGFAGYIDEQIEEGIRQKALSITRDMLLSVIFPPKNTDPELQATVMGYALNMPGMPTMSQAARHHNLGRAAISKRVRKFCQDHDLPASPYMKTDAASEKYKQTNRRKKKHDGK